MDEPQTESQRHVDDKHSSARIGVEDSLDFNPDVWGQLKDCFIFIFFSNQKWQKRKG